MTRTLEEEVMDRLTRTQKDIYSGREVGQDEIERAWQAMLDEGVDMAPEPGSTEHAIPSKESLDRLNKAFSDYFKKKTIKLRGSWKEFVFDEVVFSRAPAGSFPYKLRFRGKTHPEDIRIVDHETLTEQFYVEEGADINKDS